MIDIHWVRINDTLEMSATPITRRQWVDVMGSDPSYHKDGSLYAPVENVTYDQCVEFCNRIVARLPTDDEWTEACGDDPANIDSYAWYRGNSNATTHEVGKKLPNAFGLHDMLGNVWEWTSEECCGRRVLRGGSFRNEPGNCRSYVRDWINPDFHFDFIGFRVSRTVG